MMSIQFALIRGVAIRHRDWPPYHYAKLVKGPDGKRKLYRSYPDGRIELLDLKVGELHEEDGWLILDLDPPSASTA